MSCGVFAIVDVAEGFAGVAAVPDVDAVFGAGVADLFLEGVWKKSPRTQRLLLTGYPESIGQIPRSRRVLVRVMAKPWNDGILKRTIRHLLRDQEAAME